MNAVAITNLRKAESALRPLGFRFRKSGSTGLWIAECRGPPRHKYRLYPGTERWVEVDDTFAPGVLSARANKGSGCGFDALIQRVVSEGSQHHVV